jgi:hypothetical protein
MFSGIEMEANQMSDLSMICVDEHAVANKAAEHTMVGKNIFACGLLHPGAQSFVSPLSLRYALQERYKICTDRGHYSITPTTFVVLNEGQHGEIVVEPNASARRHSCFRTEVYV